MLLLVILLVIISKLFNLTHSLTEGVEVEEDEAKRYRSTTVNRATSPFIVKMASQVHQIPNDPAVKSLVKSVVMFNDVEYQVPTKVSKEH